MTTTCRRASRATIALNDIAPGMQIKHTIGWVQVERIDELHQRRGHSDWVREARVAYLTGRWAGGHGVLKLKRATYPTRENGEPTTMTTSYVSWQDNDAEFCKASDCDWNCGLYHRGEGDMPRRFQFGTKEDGLVEEYGERAHLVESMVDLNKDEPFGKGEAWVKDLKTGAELDVVEFLANI